MRQWATVNRAFGLVCFPLLFAIVQAQGQISNQVKPIPPQPGSGNPAQTALPLIPAGQASPKEALETFCFAWDAMQLGIEGAQAVAESCIEFPPEATPEERARFVEMFGKVMDLESPPFINLVATREKDSSTLLRQGLFSLKFSLDKEGKWRLSRQSVAILPDLHTRILEKDHSLGVDRGKLVEGQADPTELLVTFVDRAVAGDYQAAAQCLDLSKIPPESRREEGEKLAWKLAMILQRLHYPHPQNIPVDPNNQPVTYHLDPDGMIIGARVHQEGHLDRWVFTQETVGNISKLFEKIKNNPLNPRWRILGKVLYQTPPDFGKKEQATQVPHQYSSPRAMLAGFLGTMDQAEHYDSKLEEAAKFLDLSDYSQEEINRIGPKLAEKLEVILRKIRPTLSEIDDHTTAPPVTLGDGDLRVRIHRGLDNRWMFSSKTVARVPQMYQSLTLQERGLGFHLDGRNSPRETFSTFLRAVNEGQLEKAAACLDLSSVPLSARSNLGPILAMKLKTVIDRIGYVYFHELPSDSDGPPYLWHRGPLGRIQVGKSMENPALGWRFTQTTVDNLDQAINKMIQEPISEEVATDPYIRHFPGWKEAPGLRLRAVMPDTLRFQIGPLEAWQWFGLMILTVILVGVYRLAFAILDFLANRLLTEGTTEGWIRRRVWGTAFFLAILAGFWLLPCLDLPTRFASWLFSVDEIILAIAAAWAGFGLIDLVTQYLLHIPDTAPEKIRGFQDLFLPFLSRILKTVLVLSSLIYLVYCFDDGSLLGRFLAGLGVVGLAVSLAAQDSLKNLIATMLLIGDRSFSVGDRIKVAGTEGVVQSVGFRSTRLRTKEDSILILPNSILAGGTIDNLGLRQNKRVGSTLTLEPPVTPEQAAALREYFSKWVSDQAARHVQSQAKVELEGFNDRGLELKFTLYANRKAGDADKLKEDALIELLRLAEQLGLKVASVAH